MISRKTLTNSIQTHRKGVVSGRSGHKRVLVLCNLIGKGHCVGGKASGKKEEERRLGIRGVGSFGASEYVLELRCVEEMLGYFLEDTT